MSLEEELARQQAVLAALQQGWPAIHTARLQTDAAGLRAYQVNARATAQRVLLAHFPTVAAMLAWQGLHVGVVLLMGGYVLARSLRGRLRMDARAALDNTALMWHYVTVQGLAAIWRGRPPPRSSSRKDSRGIIFRADPASAWNW